MKGIREAKGLSKSQLAVLADLSIAYVSELEPGKNNRLTKSNPSAEVTKRLASALGVHPAALDIDLAD